MPPNFYRGLQLITLAISLFSMSSPFAQDVDYPKGPVKLIVPIGAGGGTDILGRKVQGFKNMNQNYYSFPIRTFNSQHIIQITSENRIITKKIIVSQ